MDKITCSQCGKSFALKPEMAGRKVRCTCGNVMAVPMTFAQVVEEDPDQYRVKPDSTGHKPLPPAPPEPPPKPSAPAVRRRIAGISTKQVEDVSQSSVIKLAITLGILLVLIIGGTIAYRMYSENQRAILASMKGDDARIEQRLKEEFNKEARLWLSEDHARLVGGWSRSQTEGKVEEFYKMGAVKVILFGSRITSFVLIELPLPPSKARNDLFQWYRNWCIDHQQKPDADVGQRYIEVVVPL